MSFESATDANNWSTFTPCMYAHLRHFHIYLTNITLRTTFKATKDFLNSKKQSSAVKLFLSNCSKFLSLPWTRRKAGCPCDRLWIYDELGRGQFNYCCVIPSLFKGKLCWSPQNFSAFRAAGLRVTIVYIAVPTVKLPVKAISWLWNSLFPPHFPSLSLCRLISTGSYFSEGHSQDYRPRSVCGFLLQNMNISSPN